MAIISHPAGLHALGCTSPGVVGRHPLVRLIPHGVLDHGIGGLESGPLGQRRRTLHHAVRPDRRLSYGNTSARRCVREERTLELLPHRVVNDRGACTSKSVACLGLLDSDITGLGGQ